MSKNSQPKGKSKRIWYRFVTNRIVWVFPLIGFLFGIVYHQSVGIGLMLAFLGFIVSLIFMFHALIKGDAEKSSFYNNSGDFDEALITLIAAVLKANTEISKSALKLVEIKLAKEYFSRDYTRLKKSLDQKLAQSKIELDAHADFVHENFSASERILLLHFLVKIAVADGVLSVSENAILQHICAKTGIPYRTLDSLLSAHRFRNEYEEKRREERPKAVSVNQLENAYKILEVTPDASDKEIKKAYKRLAVMHHPDKVAHLGEHLQKEAAEKFKIIVGAYDLICKKRGIV